MTSRKSYLLILPLAACAIVASLTVREAASLSVAPGSRDQGSLQVAASDDERIARLLAEVESIDLQSLEPLPIQPFTLPSAGVDLMRVKVEETYEIFGVGRDTVELTGWIAVRHDNPRPAPGQTEVKWGTAIMDTEFVGLDLRGRSDVFGPVRVRLDRSRRSLGQVGLIGPPRLAKAAGPSAGMLLASTGPVPPADEPGQLEPIKRPCRSCNCQSALLVNVELSDLGMSLATKSPVVMHSVVESIPPVGYTATVSLTPTELVYGGRDVGILHHARVKFREIVRHVSLTGTRQDAGGG